MAVPLIGQPSASSTDLGLGLTQQTQNEVEAVRKKRKMQMEQANQVGASGLPNAAYMSLTGNQF